jgi:hypothetical protein
MINRYSGEIHINLIAHLRNGDYNNDGRIDDIQRTLIEAIEVNNQIGVKLQQIKTWLDKHSDKAIRLSYADGGYIRIDGLPDSSLQELASHGMIQLYDYAIDKNWVIKFGHLFGLIWANGQATEV